ncbi:type II secretion system F family protein [Kroppenstedtia eburnea]|uniref:type II secretion system F family protein n=1 Tax=Kroppenstedtia eburnea TaxID=714067 RepID=UPI0036281D44
MKQTRSKTDLLHHWMDRFAPTGEKIEILSDPVELEDDLVKSGYPYGLTVKRIQGAKILGTCVGVGSGFLYWFIGMPFAPVIAIFLPFLGYMAPIYGIKFLAKRRQQQIRYELPDFLDMMSITLQAGMGLDEAFSYYVQTNKGPLSEEFARLNQEIQFGVQRETAYRSLIRRTDSSELEALIQSLIQAHNLGTPIARTFAQQAEEMRRMRAEQAKEAAGKAAPKISLVSGLVIAPSIMLLMLGAIVYSYFIERNIFGS